MTRFAALPLALLVTSFTQVSAANAPHKSPYFIDAVHCEGLDELIDADQHRWNYPSEEVAVIGTKILRQDLCEQTFKRFDIEKFKWVTPEDLETVTFELTHSQRWESVEMRLEKSELQNHVHVIGIFKPWPKHTHLNVMARSEIQAGSAAEGARYAQELSGSIGINQRGHVDPPEIMINYDFRNATAKQALTAADLTQNGKPVSMSTTEQIAQAKPSGTSDHVDVTINYPHRSGWSVLDGGFFKVGFDDGAVSGDSSTALTTRYEVGTNFLRNPLVPHSRTSASLLYADYRATVDETITGKRDTDPKLRHMMFVGLQGGVDLGKLSIDFAFYRALTNELHFFGTEHVLWQPLTYGGIAFGVGADLLLVRGAVLPEHRLGLPDRLEDGLYLSAGYDFHAFGEDHNVLLKLGNGQYVAETDALNAYARSNIYGELDYKTHMETIDVGLAFIYGNQRLY